MAIDGESAGVTQDIAIASAGQRIKFTPPVNFECETIIIKALCYDNFSYFMSLEHDFTKR